MTEHFNTKLFATRTADMFFLYLPVNLFYLAGTGMMPADVPISDTVQTSYIMGGALWYICLLYTSDAADD